MSAPGCARADLHSAQGMIIGTGHGAGVCWAVCPIGPRAPWLMSGMTRARDENHLAIYPSVTKRSRPPPPKQRHPPGVSRHHPRRRPSAAHHRGRQRRPPSHHAHCRRTHRPRLPTRSHGGCARPLLPSLRRAHTGTRSASMATFTDTRRMHRLVLQSTGSRGRPGCELARETADVLTRYP